MRKKAVIITLLLVLSSLQTVKASSGWPCLEEVFAILDALAEFGGQGVRALRGSEGEILGYAIQGGLSGLETIEVDSDTWRASDFNRWLESKGEILDDGELTIMEEDLDRCGPSGGAPAKDALPYRHLWGSDAPANAPWVRLTPIIGMIPILALVILVIKRGGYLIANGS